MSWSSTGNVGPEGHIVTGDVPFELPISASSPVVRITLHRGGGGFDTADAFYLGGASVTPSTGLKVSGPIFGPFDMPSADLPLYVSISSGSLVITVDYQQ